MIAPIAGWYLAMIVAGLVAGIGVGVMVYLLIILHVVWLIGEAARRRVKR